MNPLPIELIHQREDAFVFPVRISGRSRQLFERILREPLLHFLVLGALFYWAGTLPKKAGSIPRQTRIEVPLSEVRRMREVWTMQWHRAPRPEELQSLIDEYVREEVLYREAIAMGLDRDDGIVRRRLAQKMEFLGQPGLAAGTEPPD
jgi:peptidyl-prolyl cis-trans isomerase C